MAGYTKLFGSILDSTVWATPSAVRCVWITMLAMSDRDGIVEASVPGLAKRSGVDRGDCERALALFLAPDPDSRSREFEGRRIRPVDGGWQLLNYEKYRDKSSLDERKSKDAARQKRKRDRDAASRDASRSVTTGHGPSQIVPAVTPSAAAATSTSFSKAAAAASQTDEAAAATTGKIRCPPDLELTPDERGNIEMQGVPSHAIDSITARYRIQWLSGDARSLAQWRRGLVKTVLGDWRKEPKPEAQDEKAALAADHLRHKREREERRKREAEAAEQGAAK